MHFSPSKAKKYFSEQVLHFDEFIPESHRLHPSISFSPHLRETTIKKDEKSSTYLVRL